MAVIVMDLDGFKRINDTYGHHVGDQALRETTRALRSALRQYDVCVRYAGDEFIVVLTGCSREAADLKRRELQATVSEIRLEVEPGRWVQLAASAGAAVFPRDGVTGDALLAEADLRMYRDKSARRACRARPEADDARAGVPTDVAGAGRASIPDAVSL
jgi:diguanylate cyclase (GGDEF)-like protein